MTRTLAILAPLLAVLTPALADARPKLTPAMCEMLGMADEYISRFDYWDGKPRPNLVESFYPHEGKLAAAYEKLIAAYKKESGAKLTHKRIVGPQGHITIASNTLDKIINGFYVQKDKIATLDPKLILGASRACQLRYVKGAYARYGDQGRNAMRMANAGMKVETLGLVLKKLGCKKAAVFTTETIPTGTMVFFEPGGAIERALPVTKRLSQAEYQKVWEAAKLFKQL